MIFFEEHHILKKVQRKIFLGVLTIKNREARSVVLTLTSKSFGKLMVKVSASVKISFKAPVKFLDTWPITSPDVVIILGNIFQRDDFIIIKNLKIDIRAAVNLANRAQNCQNLVPTGVSDAIFRFLQLPNLLDGANFFFPVRENLYFLHLARQPAGENACGALFRVDISVSK